CAPNVRVYTAVVTLYANDADLRGIARTWADMLHAGVAPNLFTYTSLVVGLHKVALRKRWRAAQEAAERSDADQPRAEQPATTTQDDMIAHIEDWLFSDRAPPDVALPELFLSDVAPDVDLPLSTLLLRYHALRIRDAAASSSNESGISDGDGDADAGADHQASAAADHQAFAAADHQASAATDHQAFAAADHQASAIADDNLHRAMRVCQAVERAGLAPDHRFHAALADLFDAHGDHSGADLVRCRMDAKHRPGQPFGS
ncbi:hypothetical protein LPJ66_008705, partial [Kickxella alabastrina]